jgi:hypothetical protein
VPLFSFLFPLSPSSLQVIMFLKVKDKVTLRPTGKSPVRLGVWDPRPIFLPPWNFL